jgi:hypothetical protein
MVQSSGRFKTAHTGCNLRAKAYGAACDELSRVVRRFETALYKALLRGQSKKRHLHAHQSVSFVYNPEAKGRGHVLKCTSVSCKKQADVIEARVNSSHSAHHVLV